MIRKFTKEDWYSFGGAVSFGDGSDPFIAEFKLKDGTEVEIIVDQKGYELFLMPYKAYLFNVKVPFFDSIRAQKILIDIIEEFELAANEKRLVTILNREGWERLS